VHRAAGKNGARWAGTRARLRFSDATRTAAPVARRKRARYDSAEGGRKERSMRTLGLIAIAMLLVGVAGCAETRTLPRDEMTHEETRAKTSAEMSPPAPAAFPPHEPRPLLNR